MVRLKFHLKNCKTYIRYKRNQKNLKKRQIGLTVKKKQILKNKIGNVDILLKVSYFQIMQNKYLKLILYIFQSFNWEEVHLEKYLME